MPEGDILIVGGYGVVGWTENARGSAERARAVRRDGPWPTSGSGQLPVNSKLCPSMHRDLRGK